MTTELPRELLEYEPTPKPPPPSPLWSKPNPNGFIISLLMILSCVFLSEIYWTGNNYSALLSATGKQIFEEKEYWRLFSTIFIHSDLKHLASNMYMLSILGYFVSGYFGALIYPLTTTFFAGITNWIAISTYHPNVILLGASGLVYLLAGFWFAMYVLIERHRPLLARMIRVIGVALAVLFPTTFEPEVSYRTHFIGFVVGILVAIPYGIYFKKFKMGNSERASRRAP
jgi:rhomboid protease GluP